MQNKTQAIKDFEEEACRLFGVNVDRVFHMEITLDSTSLPKAVISMYVLDETGHVHHGADRLPIAETKTVQLVE